MGDKPGKLIRIPDLWGDSKNSKNVAMGICVIGTLEQLKKDLFVKLPGAMFIGISQGGAIGRTNPKIFQFTLTASQTTRDLPERAGSA